MRAFDALLLFLVFICLIDLIKAEQFRTLRRKARDGAGKQKADYRFGVVVEKVAFEEYYASSTDVSESDEEEDEEPLKVVYVELNQERLTCMERSIAENMPRIAEAYLLQDYVTSQSNQVVDKHRNAWGEVRKVIYKPKLRNGAGLPFEYGVSEAKYENKKIDDLSNDKTILVQQDTLGVVKRKRDHNGNRIRALGSKKARDGTGQAPQLDQVDVESTPSIPPKRKLRRRRRKRRLVVQRWKGFFRIKAACHLCNPDDLDRRLLKQDATLSSGSERSAVPQTFQQWMNEFLAEQMIIDCNEYDTKKTMFWFVK